jgi:hypothetical protein
MIASIVDIDVKSKGRAPPASPTAIFAYDFLRGTDPLPPLRSPPNDWGEGALAMSPPIPPEGSGAVCDI